MSNIDEFGWVIVRMADTTTPIENGGLQGEPEKNYKIGMEGS